MIKQTETKEIKKNLWKHLEIQTYTYLYTHITLSDTIIYELKTYNLEIKCPDTTLSGKTLQNTIVNFVLGIFFWAQGLLHWSSLPEIPLEKTNFLFVRH